MKKYDRIVLIIPALNPDEKLLYLLEDISKAGFTSIILVNDGSNQGRCIFAEALERWGDSIHLLEHYVNLGQGRAFKTAFNYYIGHFPESAGVVECDADGQHHIDDIRKCADMLLEHPDEVVLGVRNFNEKGIPFRSRFGNKCTSAVFRFCCGMDIRDTQTGLKGIPRELTKVLIETPGERFEYATSVLLELNEREIPIRQFDIRTIYIKGNESSHFHPVMDSIRIYRVLLKYICSSLAAMVLDYGAFGILSGFCKNVFVITYVGRALSAVCNFTLNKKVVFKKKGNTLKEAVKYLILLVVSGTISAAAVSWIHACLNWNLLLAKMLVETVLFFFNYYVQRNFIFREKREQMS